MNIKTIRIALMQLHELHEIKDIDDTLKSFGDFNSKYVASLNIEEILASQIGGINKDNFDDVISELLLIVFDNLLTLAKNEEANIDSVGIWVKCDDEILENSIKLSVLNDIKKYGADDINPIYEFYNMTLQKYENHPSHK